MGVDRSVRHLAGVVSNGNVDMVDKTLMPERRRQELVRLMVQEMRSLGYPTAAEVLEQESGYPLEIAEVTQFRQAILGGLWGVADNMLVALNVPSGDHPIIRFLMYEQKYLELLEMRDLTMALHVLRAELSPLHHEPQRLHRLSSYIMCTTVDDLKKQANWDGAAGESRYVLLQEIQKHISTSTMISERRLERLLDQALEYQEGQCLYHSAPMNNISLFEDHKCFKRNLPSTVVHVFDDHSDEVWYVAFSHDGKYLASSSKDGRTIIWNIETFKITVILGGHEKAVAFLAWSPDDTRILTCGTDHRLKMWDVVRGNEILNLTLHSDAVTACAWTPDGKRFVSGGLDKLLVLWNVDGKVIHKWTGARIADLCISRDGKRLVACQEKLFKVYDLDTLQETGQILEEHSITSLSISTDGNHIICNISSQEIHLWDINRECIVKKYVGQRRSKFVIRSTLGGYCEAFIVSGSEDGKTYMWHRSTGKLVEVLEGHQATVNSVSWNPVQHGLLATSSDDRTVRLWGADPNPNAPQF